MRVIDQLKKKYEQAGAGEAIYLGEISPEAFFKAIGSSPESRCAAGLSQVVEPMDDGVDHIPIGVAPNKKRGSVLQEAMFTINGERQNVYGSPEDSFRHIADYWNVYLGGEAVGIKIDAKDVAMMMTLFKIARIANGSAHRDSYVDAAGYIGLAADMCCEVKDV